MFYFFLQCPFPLFSLNTCPIIVSRTADAALQDGKSLTKLKLWSMDTNSLASSCSGQYYSNHLSYLVILYLHILSTQIYSQGK